MATLWAYRTDPGQGLRAILEGGRVEWQFGSDRGWSTLAEIELASRIHSHPGMVEALRSLLEWAREDMAKQASASASWGLARDSKAHAVAGGSAYAWSDGEALDVRLACFKDADRHRKTENASWTVTL